MIFNKLHPAARWIFSRAGIFYLLIALVAISLIDFKAAVSRVKVRRLNDARPEMSTLVAFGKGELSAEKMNWRPYLNYFSMVVKYMPSESTTKMFLGISQYYASPGQKTAWPYIQSAAEEHPFIFWSLYNAGVMAFERGHMDLCTRYLERALVFPPEKALPVIQSSTLYRQLMASSNFDVQITQEIKAVKENIYLFLAAANFYKKNYEQARVLALYPLNEMTVKDKEPFYFYAGAASISLGDPQGAMNFMSKCVEMKSKNPQVYRYAAEILKLSGQPDVAKGVLKTAVALENTQKKGFPYPERLRLRFF